ncbi:unnamed protein product [Symbiodinium natans]|uniref:Uncharacterized protein n=1 Tax=Symbiodinium natans TaxID=878477 RepID=A0A812QTV2_9DINO|nr:unnamed protein product [Symbiodinium natans]
MPQELAFLFTKILVKITPEQMIYMWNVLTFIFCLQCLMIISCCAALAVFPEHYRTCTLCFGAPFAYICIQQIYIDHDVMHGVTFPVYEFQKLHRAVDAKFKYCGNYYNRQSKVKKPTMKPSKEAKKRPAEEVSIGEWEGGKGNSRHFTVSPERFKKLAHAALQQWAGPMGPNWYKYLLTVPWIPVIHFFGLNDTGFLFTLEWWMSFPEADASWRFVLPVTCAARVGFSLAWMFITNFTPSLPWNKFLEKDPGRTWPVLHNVMALAVGGKHRWNEMLFHDVHHAFPNALGTLSQRGRFHGWKKAWEGRVEG